MTHNARIAMRYSEEVKIGLVKDSGAEEVKRVGGKISQQHKKACGKFLLLTHMEGKKNDASYMKSADEFITECDGPS